MGARFANVPSSDENDWIAGESGYVENTNFSQRKAYDIAYLGENIIYMGSGKFWGHFPDNIAFRTLPEWKRLVWSWNRGSKVDTKRELPMTGLL